MAGDGKVDACGALYSVAEKPFYIWEALLSAVSLRSCNPGVPLTLVTEFPVAGEIENFFDSITSLSESEVRPDTHPYSRKVEGLLRTPYERTLFLDADTYVAGSLAEIFDHPAGCMRLGPVLNVETDGRIVKGNWKGTTLYNTGVVYFERDQIGNISEWHEQCLAQEKDFLIPSAKKGPMTSIGDQNVFNTLQTSRRWKIFELDSMKYNLKMNVLNIVKDDPEVVAAVRIFHIHDVARNLRPFGIAGFDENLAEFRRIREASRICQTA